MLSCPCDAIIYPVGGLVSLGKQASSGRNWDAIRQLATQRSSGAHWCVFPAGQEENGGRCKGNIYITATIRGKDIQVSDRRTYLCVAVLAFLATRQ